MLSTVHNKVLRVLYFVSTGFVVPVRKVLLSSPGNAIDEMDCVYLLLQEIKPVGSDIFFVTESKRLWRC